MTEREKVVNGLECIAQGAQNGTCGPCAYFRPFTDDPDCGWCDKVAIENDALTLLREQEPVGPVCTEYDRAIVLFSCRNCKTQLLYGQRYCHMCGKKVKWE